MKNFEKRSAEYQKCLVARDDKPGKVKKQFSDITKLTREEARKPKLQKTTFSASFNFITQYKTLLPHLKTMISNHLLILCSNQQTRKRMFYRKMQQKMWYLQEPFSSFS